MGNEMGNNNTSEFREEEEKAKAESPEKSLLEGRGGEDTAGDAVDEVVDCHEKEARTGSGDADGVNGDHHITEMIANLKEEGKIEACNTAEFQVISEKSTDRTKEDNEEEAKSKEGETMEFDSTENRSDRNEHEDEHEKQASNPKEEEGETGSNLNTTILALDKPELENTSDIERVQHELPETKAEALVQLSNKSPQEDKDARGLSLDNINLLVNCATVDSERSTNMNQVIDADRDADKENNGERGEASNFDMITHASDDPKFEKTLDVKFIQHDLPETKAESLVGSSDGSPLECKYALGSSSKHTEDSGHVMGTEKSTNVEHIGAETEADVEKNIDGLTETRSCHEYIMSAADDVGETETNLMSHNSSRSQLEETLVIESPKSPVQVPEFEERCMVMVSEEDARVKEEPSGTGTIVEDSIPTEFKISNGSHSENNAEETEVPPESVDKNKNQNEALGEDWEDSDGEYLEISEDGMAISTLSVEDCKIKNDGMEETMGSSPNNKYESERRESEESLSEPVLGFQPTIHLQETSIRFQSAECTDETVSALKQETETTIEQAQKNSSDSPHYLQTASATFTETKLSKKLIDEQSARTFPFSTSGEEDQDSLGRTSNESNSDNSIGHIEMRKSPSFNIDIQSEGRAGDSEKTPLLYQIKTIEDSPNLHEISFPNPTEKRVVKLGRSDSDKSRTSFPGFAKEKEETQMEMKALSQDDIAAAKKAAEEDQSPISPIRKGKRRTKSLIFGNCMCCATAIS